MTAAVRSGRSGEQALTVGFRLQAAIRLDSSEVCCLLKANGGDLWQNRARSRLCAPSGLW